MATPVRRGCLSLAVSGAPREFVPDTYSLKDVTEAKGTDKS